VSHLLRLGYKYDKSAFPSAWFYAAMAKLVANHVRKPRRLTRYLQRHDWTLAMTSPRYPYLRRQDGSITRDAGDHSILILPLPTLGRFRPCVWHTLGYAVSWNLLMRELRGLLMRDQPFYYVMHPADYLGPEDLSDRYSHALERMSLPLGEKLERLAMVLEMICEAGRPVITVEELADHLLSTGVTR
jgi:hypothetical protein